MDPVAETVGTIDADLVLDGGGVKGIALAGAYAALHEAGYRFHRIAGTSAGAVESGRSSRRTLLPPSSPG